MTFKGPFNPNQTRFYDSIPVAQGVQQRGQGMADSMGVLWADEHTLLFCRTKWWPWTA